MVDFGTCFGGPDNSNDSVTSKHGTEHHTMTNLKFHSVLTSMLLSSSESSGDASPSDTFVAILSRRRNMNFEELPPPLQTNNVVGPLTMHDSGDNV